MEVTSSYGTISRLLNGSLTVRDRMDTLTRQASTGYVAETYGGLSPNARVSIDLRVSVGRRETYERAINTTSAKLEVMQPALEEIGSLASDMAAKALSLITLGTSGVEAIAQQARAALEDIAGLLNTQSGGQYVFGGTDSANPPVPNASKILQSGFFTQIQAATQQLGVDWDDDSDPATPDVPRSADQVLDDTLVIGADDTAGTTPFSTFLSTAYPDGALGEPRLAMVAEDGTRVTYGLVANANGVTSSADNPPSTGSFIRDMLRGLAMLGSLTENSVKQEEFTELVTGIANSLQSAGRTMEDERASLGVAERRLTSISERHADLTVLLNEQISEVEDVDIADVTSRLQLLKVQLEMSYQLIAGLRDMNLARYL